jgi:WD40 repeat protein
VIVAGISAYDADIRLWDIRKMRTSSKPTEKLSQARFITSIDPLTNLRLNLSKIIKSSPEEQSNFMKKYTSGLDIETLERISAGNSWIFKSPDSSSLLVSAVSNIIYVYENIWSIDLAPPKEYHDHRASFFIKPCISPDARYLACGSTDGSIALWNLRTDNFIGKLTNAHTGEVNAVAWSEGCEGFIASVSDDENLIIWSYEE